MPLSPVLVGGLAHGSPDLDGLGGADVAALARHGLAYTVAATADPSALRRVDPEHRLADAAREQSLRSIAVAATASRVSELLGAAGVRCLVYKGPALAVQTTGAWQGRGSADVDLLVAEPDTGRADAALRAGGCSSRAGYSGPPSRWERYHRPERAYAGLPVTIDLHWRVDSSPGYYSAPFDDLWSRREHVEHDGLDVMTFDRVDALLATAVHGAKERWVKWFWALDAVRQVEALPVGAWPLVRARSSVSGATKAVDLCVGVAAECGAVLPTGVGPSEGMRDLARRWLAASASASPIEWSNQAALDRRRARWAVADSPLAAADAFARAAARLVHDRRTPSTPQRRPDAG